jgi:hypothetical protein
MRGGLPLPPPPSIFGLWLTRGCAQDGFQASDCMSSRKFSYETLLPHESLSSGREPYQALDVLLTGRVRSLIFSSVVSFSSITFPPPRLDST